MNTRTVKYVIYAAMAIQGVLILLPIPEKTKVIIFALSVTAAISYAAVVGIINKNYKYTAKTAAALIAYAVFVALILWH